MIRDDQRAHLKALMEWTEANRSFIGYLQQRPEADVRFFESQLDGYFRRRIRVFMDCSSFVIMLANMVGFRDPSGNGFNGFGDSGEFFSNLSHFTDPLETRTGTIVVFGPQGSKHAAWVYEGGISDPRLLSHGTPLGPGFVDLSAFASEYPEHTFCSIGAL